MHVSISLSCSIHNKYYFYIIFTFFYDIKCLWEDMAWFILGKFGLSWISCLIWTDQRNVPGNAMGVVESNYSGFHTAALVSKHDSDCNAQLIWIMLSENRGRQGNGLFVREERETWDNFRQKNTTRLQPCATMCWAQKVHCFFVFRQIVKWYLFCFAFQAAFCHKTVFYSALLLSYLWKTTLMLGLAPRWNMEMRINLLTH